MYIEGQNLRNNIVTIRALPKCVRSHFCICEVRNVNAFNNNNNRRLVTLAEHTSDHGRQTNSSTEEKGEQV